MTPSEELEMEELEKFKQFKREQAQKLKEERQRAKERLRKRKETIKNTRVLARQIKMLNKEKQQEDFRKMNNIDFIKVKIKKQRKIDFHNKSIIEILSSTK